MIRRTFFSLPILLVLLLAANNDNCSLAQETDERFTEAPASVRCYGRVRDVAGNPVENARVTLIAPHGEVYIMAGKIGSKPAVLQTTTNMEGTFSLDFGTDDLRFLGVTPFVLMIQADGFETDAVEFTMTRMMVDLPHERILARRQPVRLRIRDSEGKPAAGAQVRVARINKVLLPLQIENNPVFETDAEGSVVLDGVKLDSLRSIYVQSESAGNQLVPVERNGDELIATLMPTGHVNGQIEITDGGDVSVLGSRKALVASWQVLDFRDEGPLSVSWQTVTLDGQGRFVADRIATGTLGLLFTKSEWPKIAQRMKEMRKFSQLTKDNSPLDWKLTYSPAREYKFKFIGENGEQLPRLSFSNEDMGFLGSAPSMTDENGGYSVLNPEGEKLDRQLFPQDPYGRVSLEAFGIMLDRLKYAEDGTPEPVRLTRSRALTGRVIDEQGNSVAGATVDYSYGLERFNQTGETWTDNSGRFVIRGLPPNAALEVTARKGSAMTIPGESANVVAGTKGEFTLILVEQPTAAPVGRVVDRDGNPVSGATVSINRVSVMINESYSAEETQGVPWQADLSSVTTDADGMFQYPATPGFGDRIQVNIQADGYLPFRAPFVQGSRLELVDGRLRLGDFRLLNVPPKVNATVRCIDHATGQRVSGADIVFIGVHAGRTSAKTGENGSIALTLSDTSQIAAVRADGYQVLFQSIDHVANTVEFELQKHVPGDANQRLEWFDRTRQNYLDVAQRLFSQMERPVPGKSTFYRQTLFFESLATIDPDAFYKTISDSNAAIEEKDTITLFHLTTIAKQSLRLATALLNSSKIDAHLKPAILAQFAATSTDADLKDELYGEAIVGLGALSGKDRLLATGYVAQSLILDGRISVAKSIVKSAWDQADEYQKLLKSETQKDAFHEARVFGPVLAIIDPDAALRLIPLLAIQRDVERLKDEALGALSLCDWEQLQKVCSEHNLKYHGGMAEWILHPDTGNKANPELVPWAISVVGQLEKSPTRMALCLFAAKRLPPGTERDRLMALAVQSWKVPEIVMWSFGNDPAKLAIEQLVTFDSIQPHELDQLVFACLNNAPTSFDSRNMLGVLGNAARLLGMRDTKLGRALLEPAFDDSVWLFDAIGRTWFDYNPVLSSTVWIDPVWAGDLTQHLSDRHSPDDPIRQLQLFGTIIREINPLNSGMK